MAIRRYSDRSGFAYSTPGVYLEEVPPKRSRTFRTGVPAFLGFLPLNKGEDVEIHALGRWEEFEGLSVREEPQAGLRGIRIGAFLGAAVKGFFENGGQACVVVAMQSGDLTASRSGPSPGLLKKRVQEAFAALEGVRQPRNVLNELTEYEEAFLGECIGNVDLICFPDLPVDDENVRTELQRDVIQYCERRSPNCFAILDSDSSQSTERAVARSRSLISKNAALYFPWIQAGGRLIPPCGHVAGIYARVDAQTGTHKPPANEVVEGAVNLGMELMDEDQEKLNTAGVNCIRAFRGRGIRLWGARTLSRQEEWRYIHVRRLIITFARWIDRSFDDLIFESNGPILQERIRERLKNYCYTLFQKGALKGLTPAEAFYVKCDSETTPREAQDAGMIVSEIGLAVARPAEFIVVRITQNNSGTKLEG